MASYDIDYDVSTTPTDVDFSALDRKARENLAIKMKKKPARLMARAPTLGDIYKVNVNGLYIPRVPNELQLDFYFRHFNDIALGNYRAHSSKGVDINRAIFYYELSDYNSWSNHFSVVRHNVTIMAFIWMAHTMGKDTSSFCNPNTEAFWKAYIGMSDFSYQESFLKVWHECDYQLLRFPHSAEKKIKAAVWRLRQMVTSIQHVEPENFLEAASQRRIDDAIFNREGPLLALRWVFAHMQNGKLRMEKESVVATDEEMMDLDHGMVHWSKSPVSDLLVGVTPGIVEQPLPPTDRQPWITSEKAPEILQSVQEDDLAEMMARISL
ncbi:Nn.00g013910.m01.CDS01 [Neocucurbitaria sp. VM-36]